MIETPVGEVQAASRKVRKMRKRRKKIRAQWHTFFLLLGQATFVLALVLLGLALLGKL